MTVGAACGKRSSSLGSGEEVDLCRGYKEMDAFVEPRADRPEDVLAYADGMLRVLERIRPEIPIKQPNAQPLVPPQSLTADIQLMRREIEAFRASLLTDGGRASRSALNAFAVNGSYNDADSRLSAFSSKTCPR